jgi:hypothetical protein
MAGSGVGITSGSPEPQVTAGFQTSGPISVQEVVEALVSIVGIAALGAVIGIML